MKRSQNQLMFEEKALQELVANSYEDVMTRVNNAIAEREDFFGSNATLLATYSKHAIVVNESGTIFSVGYSTSGGYVELGEKKELDIPVVTTDSLAKKAVDSFFGGDSLSEGIKGLVVTSLIQRQAPLEELRTKLNSLFSSGMLWRGFVRDNPTKMAQFAFDPAYGSPKIESKVKFEDLYDGLTEDDELEGHRGEVTEALSDIAERLDRLVTSVKQAFKKYKSNLVSDKDKEESAVLGHFESFSDDYIKDLERVSDFVSESVHKSETDCVACLAFVHDEVSKRVIELELGERLIRKVSARFAQ